MRKTSIKRTLVSIPVAGYALRLISNLVRLQQFTQDLQEQNHVNSALISRLQKKLTKESEALTSRVDSLKKSFTASQLVLDNIQQSVDAIESQSNRKTASTGQESSSKLLADDHLLDKFYTAFEDKFRGSEAMILLRQEGYLPYFIRSRISFSKTPVLDIGSGRGEFINLLKTNRIEALGIDINHDMVARSKKKGLNAIQGDALSHLQSVSSQTYGAITGFHVVEHIPFKVLIRLFTAARRSLVPGGFIILETPNPENLIVGSTTFYMDPSHLHPLPPSLLAFTLEHVGFKGVKILRLHPHEMHSTSKNGKDVTELLYGPRDYAVIAYK